MDSNRIAKLAQGVREALKKDLADSLERIFAPGSAERLAHPADVERVERLAKPDPDALVEHVAYTWFNRLCALRYMDAKGYTPVGCVTARPGESLPAILADARQGVLHPEFPLADADARRVTGLLSGSVPAPDPLGDAYVLLLLSACAAYQDSMGYLFGGGLEEKSAMRLLHPANLTADDGILGRIVAGMDDEACESVEVLGWLYQYYIAERHKEWNDGKDKAKPSDIAPATALFTPSWIVHYMTENSLGRLWMLNNPDSALADNMDYYIAPEKDAEASFIEVDGPEDITVCDPACGSGHILVYAFDLLFRMYQEEGYLDAEIPELILRDNLFGMEIDPRAAEIASFALEMKAREKDPDFFRKDVDPHITVLEPIAFTAQELQGTALAENQELLDAFEHLTECGSLYVPKPEDLRAVEDAIKAADHRKDLFTKDTPDKLRNMKADLEVLGRRYSCVIANPPYMGGSRFGAWTRDWVKQNYADYKSDLFSCFIVRNLRFAEDKGELGFMSPFVWMFIKSYEKLRATVIEHETITSLVQLEYSGFAGATVPICTFTLQRGSNTGYRGGYVRLTDFVGSDRQAPKTLEAIHNPDCGWFYRADQRDFKSIPGWPIAYWASEAMIEDFREGMPLGKVWPPRQGLATADNNRFLRFWWEVASKGIRYGFSSRQEAGASSYKWFPCDKGGDYRRWAGNAVFIINWYKDGAELFAFDRAVIRNPDLYFRPYIAWSDVSSGQAAFRLRGNGFIFEHCANAIFPDTDAQRLMLLAFLNSSSAEKALSILSPTLHFGVGQLAKMPVIGINEWPGIIKEHAVNNVALSKTDWDAFETSWDFAAHPLAQPGESLIEKQFARWSTECRERFDTLKANEEELNRIFARIYGMEGEVPIKVPDDKVSVRLADETRDVKSLISYGVGCIFGRYSTDEPGLILADAGQTAADYRAKVPQSSFAIDEDAVLPVIALEDVSLDDDIVRRFKAWLSYAYGAASLSDNVAYIERVLGCDLRSYFAKGFYKDHCDTYSVQGSGKRPIYWMFSSPKGSFQALVYMHRMNRDTVSCVLTEYVRPFRQRLLGQIGVLRASGTARDATLADRYQAMVTELEGWERDVLYPLSQQHVAIDLDEGVRHNYKLFRTDGGDALAKVQGLS